MAAGGAGGRRGGWHPPELFLPVTARDRPHAATGGAAAGRAPRRVAGARRRAFRPLHPRAGLRDLMVPLTRVFELVGLDELRRKEGAYLTFPR